MKVSYSPNYYADIGPHVFPVVKYRLTYERLLREKVLKREDFVEPAPAADEDVILVHTREYVDKLKQGKLSVLEQFQMELPFSRELVSASWLGAGGSILAAKNALTDGAGVNLAGGFHHAFSDHGEGFCMLNDVAIAARGALREKGCRRVLIVDCDLHQGNGTAAVFARDTAVFTFSIHQENNYPGVKPPGNLDIGLADGTGDEEYLGHLKKDLPKIVSDFGPDLLIYLAGADPYRDDQLGGLALSLAGLKERDELIFGLAKERGLAVAAMLAGGYAHRVEDTVAIHFNMVKTAKDMLG